MTGAYAELAGNAILGIDTLWGGDVMCPSGTGRFIADSWFSDEPLPPAYTHPAAARLRASGGVAAKTPDQAALEEYLAEVDVRGAIRVLEEAAAGMARLRADYVRGLALCFDVMWDLAMEILGRGEPVPYDRCVRASTGRDPEPSRPEEKLQRLAELLRCAGYAPNGGGLLGAVDAWRRERAVPMASVRALSSAFIAEFDRLSAAHVLPHLPEPLHDVPRANIQFLPIREAWFSGSAGTTWAGRGGATASPSTRRLTRSTPRWKSRCPSSSN